MRIVALLAAAALVIGAAGAQTLEEPAQATAQTAPAAMTDAEVRAAIQELAFRPYAPAGAPTFIASGAVARGGRLAAVPLRHTRTGVIRGLASVRSMAGQLDNMTIAEGTPVYMTQTIDGRRVWCGRPLSPDTWMGACLFVNPANGAPMWLGTVGWNNESIYYPRQYTGSYPLRDPLPRVVEEPVDMGVTLEMVWEFTRWSRDHAQIRRTVYDSLGKRSRLPDVRAPRDADGSARVAVAGGELLLRPDGQGAIVEVARAIELESEAARVDVSG